MFVFFFCIIGLYVYMEWVKGQWESGMAAYELGKILRGAKNVLMKPFGFLVS